MATRDPKIGDVVVVGGGAVANDLARVHLAHGLALDRRDAAEFVLKRIATADPEVPSEALRSYAKRYLDNNGLVYE